MACLRSSFLSTTPSVISRADLPFRIGPSALQRAAASASSEWSAARTAVATSVSTNGAVNDQVVGMVVINNPEEETVMVVSENGYGKRSQVEDYRVTNRGGKGVKTLNITDKTGLLVAIKNVTDENDLMIINKSGIVIRLAVSDCRVMGRATQGVKLINLEKKNDVIASVCKVMCSELEA